MDILLTCLIWLSHLNMMKIMELVLNNLFFFLLFFSSTMFIRLYLTHVGMAVTHTMMKHLVLLSVQVKIEQKRKGREEVKGSLYILVDSFFSLISLVLEVYNQKVNIFITFLSASFELMRKEQQKAFQEKQKLNADKQKDEFDISTLLVDSKDDEGISSKSKQFDEAVLLPATNKDSDKSVLAAQAPASRPLVPPGFANATLERNHGTKIICHSHSSAVIFLYFLSDFMNVVFLVRLFCLGS